MGEVLEHLGAGCRWEDGGVAVDATHLSSVEAPYELVRRMRASIAVLGPLLARTGEARVAMPGGDNIGSRPIDLHLDGLRRMGARDRRGARVPRREGRRAHGRVDHARLPERGRHREPDDGGGHGRGVSVIDNAAREPEIADLAAFLVAMGAGIHGAGSATIEVEGVEALEPAEHTAISDRIEAGTWAAAAVATRGDVVLDGARPNTSSSSSRSSAEGGAEIRRTDDGLRVRQPERARAADFVTLPYPGHRDRLPADPAGDARRRRTGRASRPRTSSRAGSPTWTSCGGWAPTSAPRGTTR